MKDKSFNIIVAYTCLVLAAFTVMACIYPFGKSDIQVVCRAYPSQYAQWQFAPPGRIDSEHRWVENCNDADLFFQAYSTIWSTYSNDSITWCVECSELPDCPEQFNTCK